MSVILYNEDKSEPVSIPVDNRCHAIRKIKPGFTVESAYFPEDAKCSFYFDEDCTKIDNIFDSDTVDFYEDGSDPKIFDDLRCYKRGERESTMR
ncbi:hypothetical protein PITC_058480 [Penicillium italicum]|uniref:Uncharacterized protein n=1 Tax=Penicillium italicum TaxID=40296 RepID=A0A0A2L7F5_PENIT|nr:hypothetical protein PITC_058480 [Penicillium italicum]